MMRMQKGLVAKKPPITLFDLPCTLDLAEPVAEILVAHLSRANQLGWRDGTDVVGHDKTLRLGPAL